MGPDRVGRGMLGPGDVVGPASRDQEDQNREGHADHKWRIPLEKRPIVGLASRDEIIRSIRPGTRGEAPRVRHARCRERGNVVRPLHTSG